MADVDDIPIPLADGRTLQARVSGPIDGWPVFYFHGFPGSRLEVDPATRATGETRVRLIALDRPGFGGSTPLPGRTLLQWPDDVAAAAAFLDLDRFSVLGVSGGTPYALACAAALPDRIHRAAIVSGLGRCDRAADLDEVDWLVRVTLSLARERSPMLLAPMRLLTWISQAFPTLLLAIFTARVDPADRVVLRDPSIRKVLTASLGEATRHGPRCLAADLSLLASPWGFDVEQLAVPCAFWHGRSDQVVPYSMIEDLARRVPGARVHPVDDGGHYSVPIQHASEVLSWVRDPPTTPPGEGEHTPDHG